mmetsp:Transcript_6460/g.20109  ORF Transcript_6460/g.20109 Transcript_6460/m.20109 type:complete len:204 (-) Transcript_6460:1103-1714(-)
MLQRDASVSPTAPSLATAMASLLSIWASGSSEPSGTTAGFAEPPATVASSPSLIPSFSRKRRRRRRRSTRSRASSCSGHGCSCGGAAAMNLYSRVWPASSRPLATTLGWFMPAALSASVSAMSSGSRLGMKRGASSSISSMKSMITVSSIGGLKLSSSSSATDSALVGRSRLTPLPAPMPPMPMLLVRGVALVVLGVSPCAFL